MTKATTFTKIPSRTEWREARDGAGGKSNMVLTVNVGELLDKVTAAKAAPAARRTALLNLQKGLESYAKNSKVKGAKDLLATVESLRGVAKIFLDHEDAINASLASLENAVKQIDKHLKEAADKKFWEDKRESLMKIAFHYGNVNKFGKELYRHLQPWEGAKTELGDGDLAFKVDGMDKIESLKGSPKLDELVSDVEMTLHNSVKPKLYKMVRVLREQRVNITGQSPELWIQ